MKIVFILPLIVLLSTVVKAQSRFGPSVITTGATTVTPVTSGAVQYIALNEVVLRDGFEVTFNGTSSTNDFQAYIEKDVLNLNNITYSPVLKELTAAFAVTYNDKLYFKYDEKYKVGYNLNYKVYSFNRTSYNSVVVPVVSLGEAYYELNIKTLLNGFVANAMEQYYFILEITNDKNEVYYLRFRYIPTT
ncbi:MAG: hypothetical protein MUE33_01275 [Cytophagaceae bacterium]|jgi:hypothetical protein|nr:hypothetical protein [Cytophagaceae bacterium]